jgi:long-subunit acyl-CoA synthetase (AMP-forming)
VWIQITGVAGEDDFGYTTTKGHSLVVSERIKEIIVNSGIVNCELVQLENWTGRRNAILEKIRKFRVTHPPPER